MIFHHPTHDVSAKFLIAYLLAASAGSSHCLLPIQPWSSLSLPFCLLVSGPLSLPRATNSWSTPSRLSLPSSNLPVMCWQKTLLAAFPLLMRRKIATLQKLKSFLWLLRTVKPLLAIPCLSWEGVPASPELTFGLLPKCMKLSVENCVFRNLFSFRLWAILLQTSIILATQHWLSVVQVSTAFLVLLMPVSPVMHLAGSTMRICVCSPIFTQTSLRIWQQLPAHSLCGLR